MTSHVDGILKRTIQSCSCGHGEVWHEDKYGKCSGLVGIYSSVRCNCKGFELQWYINKDGKFNAFGKRIR